MIRQLSIKLDNQAGMLGKCVGVLAKEGIDIKALEVTDRGNGDFGEVHLIATHMEKAIAVLKDAGYPGEVDEVLVIEMDDRVGFLANVLDLLHKQNLNIRYLYAFVSRVEGKSLAVFKVDDTVAAEKVLVQGGVPVVTQNKIDTLETGSPFAPSIEDHFGGDFIW